MSFHPAHQLDAGPDLEGLWIVALSTPVRISVSFGRGPQGTHPNTTGWNRLEGRRDGDVAATTGAVADLGT
jgi:hypothetical protein